MSPVGDPTDGQKTPAFGHQDSADRQFPVMAVSIAAVAVLILVGFFVVMGRRHGAALDLTKLQPLASYSPKLALSNIVMSEAANPLGGKMTYIDGHIANQGPLTVTAVTVQVLFANDQQMPPQIETASMSLIRSREPYIDAEPMSAAPLKPGAEADFRLIFESVNENWNQQLPEIHIIQVGTR